VSDGAGFVLDASALLAHLLAEPGGEIVRDALAEQAAVMSAVNWAEVLSRLASAGADPDEVAERLASEAALGDGTTGLNLTAANHVIHFDRWWNPAVEDQATDRAFRIGQRKNVQVRKMMCVGTLEERIDRLLADKRDLADRIVGTGEAWLTELDTGQLRELVALSADAVAA